MPSPTRFLVLAAVAAAVGLAACTDESEAPIADSAQPVVQVDTPAAPRPGDPDCPFDRLWKECALIDRIAAAGLGPRITSDTLRVPFFSVPGVRYRIGRTAVLTAFYFPDSTTAIREVAEIDTIRMRAAGDTVATWSGTPNYMRSANLIAVLESDDARQIERTRLAVTAGIR